MVRWILAFALTLPPVCASALDLSSMSAHSQRMACVAYGLLDVQSRRQAGAIDEATYQRERTQLGWRVQNKGDNYNYARDFRQVETYANAIIAEKPSPEAFTAQVRACREILRL